MLKGWRVWRIIRPPRVAHWYRWGQWVKNFDHHWMWLSWCIGKGNYLYFWLFLLTLNLLYFLVILLSLMMIFIEGKESEDHGIADNFQYYPYLLFYIMLSIPILAFAFPLFLFHMYLSIKGITTYEYYKLREAVSRDSLIKI